MTAGIVGVFGIVPGMPNLAFLSFAAVAGGGAYLIYRRQQAAPEPDSVLSEAMPEDSKPPELSWDDVQELDVLGLEVGYRLIPMVDQSQNGQLLERVKGVRRKISQELGFLVPPVHIRDNLDLKPNQYRILLMGVTSGEGEVFPDRELAINPGQILGEVQGVKTTDPTFGLEAV